MRSPFQAGPETCNARTSGENDTVVIGEPVRGRGTLDPLWPGEDDAVKRVMVALVLAIFGSTPAFAQDRIGEYCSGTETIVVGASVPRVVPYSLTFSADLTTGYYCYAQCKAEQSFAISDASSDPIKLADVHHGNQIRLITFSRKSGRLSDDQVFEVLETVKRSARATCRAAAFHEPTPSPRR